MNPDPHFSILPKLHSLRRRRVSPHLLQRRTGVFKDETMPAAAPVGKALHLAASVATENWTDGSFLIAP
jgi:hypothetical protein